MDRSSRFLTFGAALVAFALWWGPHVALAANWTKAFGQGGRGATMSRSASSVTYTATKGANGTYAVSPGAGTAYGNYGYGAYAGGGVVAEGTVAFPAAAGMSLPVTLRDVFTPANLANAAGFLGKSMGPVAMAAAGAVALANFLNDNGFDPCASGDRWCQPGTPSAGAPAGYPPPTATAYTGYMSTYAGAMGAVCYGITGTCMVQGGTAGYVYIQTWTNPALPCCIYGSYYATGSPGAGWTMAGIRTFYYETTCPAGSTLSGGSCVGSSGAPLEYATDEDRRMAIESGTSGLTWPVAAATGILAAGGSIVVPDVSVLPATGPSTLPVSTSTSVAPDGTTTTTSTSITPTYAPDSVTMTKTETETVTPPGGPSTTTTTTTAPDSLPGSPAPGLPGLCDLFPNIVACWTSGDITAPEALAEDPQTVSLTPETVAGGAGYCPEPIVTAMSGQSFTFSWQPVCDVATGVNGIIIALGWIAAAYILFGAIRGNA